MCVCVCVRARAGGGGGRGCFECFDFFVLCFDCVPIWGNSTWKNTLLLLPISRKKKKKKEEEKNTYGVDSDKEGNG